MVTVVFVARWYASKSIGTNPTFLSSFLAEITWYVIVAVPYSLYTIFIYYHILHSLYKSEISIPLFWLLPDVCSMVLYVASSWKQFICNQYGKFTIVWQLLYAINRLWLLIVEHFSWIISHIGDGTQTPGNCHRWQHDGWVHNGCGRGSVILAFTIHAPFYCPSCCIEGHPPYTYLAALSVATITANFPNLKPDIPCGPSCYLIGHQSNAHQFMTAISDAHILLTQPVKCSFLSPGGTFIIHILNLVIYIISSPFLDQINTI